MGTFAGVLKTLWEGDLTYTLVYLLVINVLVRTCSWTTTLNIFIIAASQPRPDRKDIENQLKEAYERNGKPGANKAFMEVVKEVEIEMSNYRCLVRCFVFTL